MYIIYFNYFQFPAKTFTEFISNYKNDLLQQLNNEKLKNKKLEDEIQKLKNISQNQLNELNTLRNNIKNLQNENNMLKQRLSGENQFNEINNLKQIIIQKDKEINKLQSKLSKNKEYMDDIMVINFLFTEQYIRCGISCLSEDTFAEVEEKLYQQFNEFRDTNNILLFKGTTILRFKKVRENNIHNGDTIQIVKPEEKNN